MAQGFRPIGLPGVVTDKPIQAAKFVGILLTLVLGIAGFLRLIDARAIVGEPLLGDGQFLALLLLPVLSLVLIGVVFAETLLTGYRVVRSDDPVKPPSAGRAAYVLLRGGEAAVAVLGVLLIAAAIPPLLAESTPAPAGVGIMLLLFVVGLLILGASFVRSGVELFVWR